MVFVSHAIYLLISALFTVCVGRSLYTNGRLFLLECWGEERLADSVNKILLLGFYLLNVIAGPILATVMGSLGVHFYARPRRLMPSSPPKRLQLSIRHLMVATACFAVAFCVAKVLNGTEFVWLFALWLLIQGALLAIAHAFHYCRSEKNVLKEGRSR